MEKKRSIKVSKTKGMSENDILVSDLKIKALRQLAEKRLIDVSKKQKEISLDEAKKIVHELQVHQIELEIQNEELRLAQNALDISREKYFDLYNFAPVGYITLNKKGIIIETNYTASNLLGVVKSEMINKAFTKFIFKEDQDIYYLFRKRLIETKANQQFDLRINRSGNSYFWAHLDTILPVKENDTIFNLITLDDISKQKEYEESLQENKRFLNETQIIAKLGTYSLDIISDKWTSSDVLDKIFGIDSDFDKSTKGWVSIIHPEWQEKMYDYFIREVLGRKTGFDKEYKIIRQNDKAERWVHGIGELKFNGKKQPISMVGAIRDITEQKNAEEIILHQNEELQRVNSEKDKFFSIIAHDISGPFTGFLGFTELLRTDLQNMTINELQDIANRLNSSANNLFGLLTNLLKWSAMQRGLTTFSPEKLSINDIINWIVEIFLETAGRKDIEIIEEISENIILMADKAMLETIIRNLLSNAIKFTNKGGQVIISANKLGNNLIISVKDSGIGMSNDLINDLFRIDIRTSRKGTENEPSTGLGLFLCKEFVDKHNGKIWVISEEGTGSEFVISLPLQI